jgi:hypothetical protein
MATNGPMGPNRRANRQRSLLLTGLWQGKRWENRREMRFRIRGAQSRTETCGQISRRAVAQTEIKAIGVPVMERGRKKGGNELRKGCRYTAMRDP